MAALAAAVRLACMGWLLTFLSVSRAQHIKGPPQINPEEATDLQVVKLGEQVKLVCPVSSASHLLVDWTKDGEKVDETWPRFRFSARNLRVKSATADLSGIYRCKGVTGYGTVQHQIKLVVIDPTDEQFMSHSDGLPAGNDYPSLNSRRFSFSPPKITQVYPAQSPIRKMAGGRVRFKCVASGMPKPDIKWFKDGVEVREFRSSKVDLSAPGQLSVTRLSRSDSGAYECRVTSALGHDSASFQLDVEEPYEQKPEIVGDDPQNATVDAGEQVSLQCRVNGHPPMHVKWLKRLDPNDAEAARNATRAIEVLNGDRYHVLNVSDTVSSSPDQYLIKLTLTRARPSDAGQYVCLGANNGGFTVRTAYLTVRGVQTYPFRSGSSSHVYLMIIIPVGIVVVLALAAICCLCQRRKLSQTPDDGKSDAEASLMGTRIMMQLPPEKQRSDLSTGSETSRGAPVSCSLASHHGRRYDPLAPHPTPAPSEHLYMMAPVGGSASSRRSEQSNHSGEPASCCSCGPALPALPPREPPSHTSHHHHRHLHYVC